MLLENLEIKRKRLVLSLGLVIILMLASFVLLAILKTEIPFYIISIGLVSLMLGYLDWYKPLKQEFKKMFFMEKFDILEVNNLNLIAQSEMQNNPIKQHVYTLISQYYKNKEYVFELDDQITFNYKKRKVDLFDCIFSKNGNKYHYLIFTTNYPDKVKGKTVSYNDTMSWNFDSDITVRIRTESPIFDELFNTYSTHNITARLHLKTNVMADMLDITSSTEYNFVFYFENSRIFIIKRTRKDLFDPNIFMSFKNPKQYESIKNDIQKCLYMFDTLWLNRKA